MSFAVDILGVSCEAKESLKILRLKIVRKISFCKIDKINQQIN